MSVKLHVGDVFIIPSLGEVVVFGIGVHRYAGRMARCRALRTGTRFEVTARLMCPDALLRRREFAAAALGWRDLAARSSGDVTRCRSDRVREIHLADFRRYRERMARLRVWAEKTKPTAFAAAGWAA